MTAQFNAEERGSGDMGPRPSRGKSIADTAKPALEVKKQTDQRRGSAVFDADKGDRAKGSFGAVRKKSAGMSKEGKMKQKKADEASLRKNKVIWRLIYHQYIMNFNNIKTMLIILCHISQHVVLHTFHNVGISTNEKRNGPASSRSEKIVVAGR